MAKKALIVVDMQKDFIDGALANERAQKIVGNVVSEIEIAHALGDDVYFTFDTHRDNYMDTQEGANLPVPHCVKYTGGWYLDDAVEAVHWLEDIDVEKPVFGSVQLGELIRDGHYDEVTLVGVCTDICVISNAMVIKAFDPEVKIRVLKKATAGLSEASEEIAFAAMKTCQIAIVE